MADTMRNLSRYGATQGKAIAKAAVLYTLGAALFCAENARQPKPLARNARRAAYEGADYGRATERHWLLGVSIAKACADAVAETLAGNADDAASMVARLAAMLVNDAAAAGQDITDGSNAEPGKVRIVWSKLDAWVSTGATKVPAGVVERAGRMVKAAEKLRDECPAADRAALAAEMDKVRAALADMAKALRALDADAALLDAAKANGVARETVERLAA